MEGLNAVEKKIMVTYTYGGNVRILRRFDTKPEAEGYLALIHRAECDASCTGEYHIVEPE